MDDALLDYLKDILDPLMEDPFTWVILLIFLFILNQIIFGFLSGWNRLLCQYPNRKENQLATIKGGVGTLNNGGVGTLIVFQMEKMVNFDICPSGLRVRMKRFGIFYQDFFVPWSDIEIKRKSGLFAPIAILEFANSNDELFIDGLVADRLIQASQGRLSEAGIFQTETQKDILNKTIKEWVKSTIIGSLFFIIVPRLMFDEDHISITETILFCAIAFGIIGGLRYFDRLKMSRS